MQRFITHLLRGLSGGGALDNVAEVLAGRADLDARLASFEARVAALAAAARDAGSMAA